MRTLEPRVIEPGYWMRWTKMALRLLSLNFHLWFAMALLFCGACYLARNVYLLRCLICVPFVLFSLEMAALSTHRVVKPREVWQLLSRAVRGAYEELWDVRIGVLFVALITVLTDGLNWWLRWSHPSPDAPSAGVDYSEVWNWLNWHSPLGMGLIGLLAALSLITRGSGFGTVVHQLHQGFGLGYPEARQLHFKATMLNREVSARVATVEFAVLIVGFLFAPFVAPLLLCLIPAMHYVMFKELFDPDGLPAEEAKPMAQPIAVGSGG